MLQAENIVHEQEMGPEVPADFPNNHFYPCWYSPSPDSDYFNLLAFNEKGQALIVEDLTANSAWGSWHLVNGILQKGEDPIQAVQDQLLKFTGYQSDHWLYLGSFMLNTNQPDVNGHFFAALGVKDTDHAHFFDVNTCSLKWVSRKDLKYALLDGRIGVMSYAVTASLALLLSPNMPFFPDIE